MSDASQSIDDLRTQFLARLDDARSDAALKALQDEFLGRKSGAVTALMKTLGALPADERREFGARINTFKAQI